MYIHTYMGIYCMWSGNRSHKLGFFVYISGIQNPSCWVDEHPLVVWRVPNFETTTTYLVWDQSSAHHLPNKHRPTRISNVWRFMGVSLGEDIPFEPCSKTISHSIITLVGQYGFSMILTHTIV